ncbi:hypothetical protein PVAP13_3NG279500 [Panicum virgatum]|uniref:Metallo-beta-lactamase domain-containing protein n=1 Tax=Panicum virgatum TaxID=38727 RepID=A0A8T0UM56_PANVG|nr:hypothetical protein PVAP13_3NG279500 [Panicum virgatum]
MAADAVPNGHAAADAPPPSSSSLVFLGTGCSSAVPNARCLIQPPDPPCPVCSQSLSVPPELNPNYRCNTSLLIDYCRDEGAHKYIIIDVGKTFREQVLRWFVRHKIPCVDSILLTHEHADAILGLDDIRVVQAFSPTNDIDPTPIYLSQFAMDSISLKFPYLVKKKLKEGEEVRRVAQLDWRIIESDLQKPFTTSGLEFVPLPTTFVWVSFSAESQKLHTYQMFHGFLQAQNMQFQSLVGANWIYSSWIAYTGRVLTTCIFVGTRLWMLLRGFAPKEHCSLG